MQMFFVIKWNKHRKTSTYMPAYMNVCVYIDRFVFLYNIRENFIFIETYYCKTVIFWHS